MKHGCYANGHVRLKMGDIVLQGEQLVKVRAMLGQQAVGIAQIDPTV
jgi:hypothetical protein